MCTKNLKQYAISLHIDGKLRITVLNFSLANISVDPVLTICCIKQAIERHLVAAGSMDSTWQELTSLEKGIPVQVREIYVAP